MKIDVCKKCKWIDLNSFTCRYDFPKGAYVDFCKESFRGLWVWPLVDPDGIGCSKFSNLGKDCCNCKHYDDGTCYYKPSNFATCSSYEE